MNHILRCKEVTNNLKLLNTMYNNKEYKSNLCLTKIKELMGIIVKENVDLLMNINNFCVVESIKYNMLPSSGENQEYTLHECLIRVKDLVDNIVRENIDLLVDVNYNCMIGVEKPNMAILSKEKDNLKTTPINPYILERSLIDTYGINLTDYYLLQNCIISVLGEENFIKMLKERVMKGCMFS